MELQKELEIVCCERGYKPPLYEVGEAKAPATGFVCKLDDNSTRCKFSSVGDLLSEEASKESAAQKALEGHFARPASSLSKRSTSWESVVREIVRPHANGVTAEQVQYDYLRRTGKPLPADWLDQLMHEVDVDVVGQMTIVYPRTALPAQVHFASDTMLASAVVIEPSGVAAVDGAATTRTQTLALMSPVALAAQLKPAALTRAERARATVTVSMGVGEFWLRLVADEAEYAALRSELVSNYEDVVTEKNSMDVTSRRLYEVLAGGLYAARFENQWHRVIVENNENLIMRGPTTPAEGSVQVFFVDHGDCESVAVADLRYLIPSVVDAPPRFAICCRLQGVGEVSERVNSLFELCVFDNADMDFPTAIEVEAEFCSKVAENSYEVVLRRAGVSQASINQAVMEAATCLTAEEGDAHSASPSSAAADSSLPSASVSSAQSFVAAADALCSGGSGDVAVGGVSLRRSLVPLDVAGCGSLRVVVVYAPDPSCFSVQNVELAEQAEALEQAVAVGAERSGPIGEPIPGCFYACRHDGRWRRAYLIGAVAEAAPGALRVLLVDLAMFALVSDRDLAVLSTSAFALSNMLAIKCQLAGVAPLPPDTFWSEAAQRAFEQRVMSARFEMQVVGKQHNWQPVAQAPAFPLVAVRLVDALSKEDIAQWLIKCGFAVASA